MEKTALAFARDNQDSKTNISVTRYGNVMYSRGSVIPLFVKQFMNYESPVINGDGNYSRDFTYIDNVIQMNELAMSTQNPEAVNTVYNTAYGERTTLTELVKLLKDNLAIFDSKIADVEVIYGPSRAGDIPHSLASIEKAKIMLGYQPKFSIKLGIKESISWYFNNLR
jgi:UDP-N-acetylglucosamine 4-epimerase